MYGATVTTQSYLYLQYTYVVQFRASSLSCIVKPTG